MLILTALAGLGAAVATDTVRQRRQQRRPPSPDRMLQARPIRLLRRSDDPQFVKTLDLSFLEEDLLEPPKECEVWLHNHPEVEGFFVADLLKEVFGLEARRAFRTMMQAHQTGVGLVLIEDCLTAEGRVARARVLAREGGYPHLEFSIIERDMD